MGFGVLGFRGLGVTGPLSSEAPTVRASKLNSGPFVDLPKVSIAVPFGGYLLGSLI